MRLHRASFDELAREAAHRGYRLMPAAQQATLDGLVPMPADLLAEIRAGLQLIPGLCAQVRELMGQLAVANGVVRVLVNSSPFDEGLAELLEDQ